jgi:uncharacterized protein
VASPSIWVDADACPNVIKEILFRAAQRTGVGVTLVANQPLRIPRIPSLRVVQVASGFDVADGEIVKCLSIGDLVITADIPLAAEVIAKGGVALNPRGEKYSADTIQERAHAAGLHGYDALERPGRGRTAATDAGGPKCIRGPS